jgi:sulfide:quinone oxidoreductase
VATRQRPDSAALLVVDANCEELLELSLFLVEDPERRIARPGDLAGDLEDAVEHVRKVELSHERAADFQQSLDARGADSARLCALCHDSQSNSAAGNYGLDWRERTDGTGLQGTDASRMSTHKVVIAGGGVAALEALLFLRELAEERVEIDLLTPNSEFVYRPMELAALFRDERPRRFDLNRIAADQGATLVGDRLEGVWPDGRVVTQSGSVVRYDSLLIAIGARLRVGVPGAITVAAPGFRQEFARALDDLERGFARRLAFVAPAGIGWLLPLYELALMTADHLAERDVAAELLVVTPEDAPLEVFGIEASSHVDGLLTERGIELLSGHRPINVDVNGLVAAPAGLVEVDRVVALPSMKGPGIRGIPETFAGFIATDRHCRVLGMDGVYAAGDGTAFPVKQGGLAAQQADAAAAAIAAAAGAEIEPEPFAPVLRGLLLTGAEPHYLRHDLTQPAAESETADRPLWWPAAKIAARSLAPYLAARPGLELRRTT